MCNADGLGPSSPQRSAKDCATGFERERLSNLLMRGIPPIIPPKANRRKPIACNYRCDRDRNSASSVSLVIGPWNYPYQLSLASAVAAMAAGCTVILKPSELTAHSSVLLAKLIKGIFDPSYFAFIEGRVPETRSRMRVRTNSSAIPLLCGLSTGMVRGIRPMSRAKRRVSCCRSCRYRSAI